MGMNLTRIPNLMCAMCGWMVIGWEMVGKQEEVVGKQVIRAVRGRRGRGGRGRMVTVEIMVSDEEAESPERKNGAPANGEASQGNHKIQTA